ncbi:MarR family winged helix-turn-helix transcriptional regulator [Aliikangiella maris]|uniref:MarR family winged helix-turn-helix transcriptional regulator n=2 Tax=Aliikangiella maris TaxID=3162458 RepID=A0ABV3MRQ2_9GAMM
MNKIDKTYNLLERISTLFRSEIRLAGIQHGLHPVHIEVLSYLSRCNRLSNTPASVSEYLGVTKGTISQSISLLESKELLEKVADEKDRRVVHLNLTDKGKQLIENSMPPTSFRSPLEKFSEDEVDNLHRLLDTLLNGIQKCNKRAGFSHCKTCVFNSPKSPSEFYCELTKEELPWEDGYLICREHAMCK